MYQIIKNNLIKHVPNFQKKFEEIYVTVSSRRYMKSIIKKKKLPKLSPSEIKAAKSYYKSKGYNLKNTYWHRYYKAMNGEFHKEYVPYDIFNPKINPRLNKRKQWPALLDKNLSYNLFEGFAQPKRVVQNINGFYYIEEKIVNLDEAIKACNRINKRLIIKPTIDSGKGRLVNAFTVENYKTSYENLNVKELFQLYKKDFIVQEFLEQSEVIASLNPSSLNTLRVVTYLNLDGVHVLSSVLRIGELGSSTDNFSKGGLFCGILKDGQLKGKGYSPNGTILTKTSTGIVLKECKIPNYEKLQDMTKLMHFRVPYFKIISWDIAINKNNEPVLIEYNTHRQGIDLQIASGPLFGKFADEILDIGLQPY